MICRPSVYPPLVANASRHQHHAAIVSSANWPLADKKRRQHFQGLRRAQNKAEADGTHTDSSRRADPTLNPITRRPGPGRGRPRKSQVQDQVQSDMDVGDVSPTGLSAGIPTTVSVAVSSVLPGGMVSSPMTGHGPGLTSPVVSIQQQQHQQLQAHQFQQQQFQQQLQQHQVQLQPQLKTELGEGDVLAVSAQTSNHMVPNHLVGSDPESETTPPEQLQLDAVQSGDDDTDEHPSKRQRLDPHDLSQDSALDDEAVLALAAHNGTDGTDPYPAE